MRWPRVGHPGGCIRSSDVFVDGFWKAPAAFHGDWSAAYGQTVSYDVVSFFSANWKMNDIYIQGNGQTLTFWHSSNAPLAWATFTAKLDAAAGWQYGLNYQTNDAVIATEAQIRSVLSSVTDVRIRQEYVWGSDDSALDNVTVNAVIVPPPNPRFGTARWTNAVVTLPLQNLMPYQSYQLEQTSALSATNAWQSVTQFTATNTTQTLTLPASSDRMFYRAKSW